MATAAATAATNPMPQLQEDHEPVGAILMVGIKGPGGAPIEADRFHFVSPNAESGVRRPHDGFKDYNSAKAELRQSVSGHLVHAAVEQVVVNERFKPLGRLYFRPLWGAEWRGVGLPSLLAMWSTRSRQSARNLQELLQRAKQASGGESIRGVPFTMALIQMTSPLESRTFPVVGFALGSGGGE